jgi:hypothetical protein
MHLKVPPEDYLPPKIKMGITARPLGSSDTSLHQVAHAENGSMSLRGPKRRKTMSTPMSAVGELSGLVVLTLSSSGFDPERSSREEMRRTGFWNIEPRTVRAIHRCCGQSPLMLAARITFAHFSVSAAIIVAKPSGPTLSTRKLRASNTFTTSGCCRISAVAAWIHPQPPQVLIHESPPILDSRSDRPATF